MGFLNGQSSFASILYSLIGIINMLVSVLAALALVAFFIGLVRYVKDAGDAKGHAEGRERIIWSLIALFILFSIWGILNLLSITFFGSTNLNQGGSYAPNYQYSPSTYPAM
jgi:heme/copper-type cytochrome/quinol oxidase subunit 2